MKCPHCGAKPPDVIRHKTNKYAEEKTYCKKCSNWGLNKELPKVLLFDIETSRIKIEKNVWQMGFHKPKHINHNDIVQDWFMLSWTGKWLFDNEPFGGIVTPKEAKNRDDSRITKSLHKVINQSDIVITHNGNSFDIKNINWRFLMHNLPPVQRYHSIDTYRKSKQVFGVTSYSLDFMCKQLGYGQKKDTDYGLWEKCEAGDKEALSRMYDYNMNDSFLLEDLYVRIRGWMKTHPNFVAYTSLYQTLEKDERICKRCSFTVHDSKFTKKTTTPAGYVYKACNCPNCGALLRKTVREPNQNFSVV